MKPKAMTESMKVPALSAVRRPRSRGFTLIELMIAVAIIAILSAVAIPIYTDYITRSRLVDASTGLATMRAQMERYYQDNRTYANTGSFVAPCKTTSATTRTFGSFVVTCINTLDDKVFTLQADGSGATSGFTFTINQQEVRATTSLPSSWGGADGACTSKWIMKKGDSC